MSGGTAQTMKSRVVEKFNIPSVIIYAINFNKFNRSSGISLKTYTYEIKTKGIKSADKAQEG